MEGSVKFSIQQSLVLAEFKSKHQNFMFYSICDADADGDTFKAFADLVLLKDKTGGPEFICDGAVEDDDDPDQTKSLSGCLNNFPEFPAIADLKTPRVIDALLSKKKP